MGQNFGVGGGFDQPEVFKLTDIPNKGCPWQEASFPEVLNRNFEPTMSRIQEDLDKQV